MDPYGRCLLHISSCGNASSERLEHRVHRGQAMAKIPVPKEILHQSPQARALRLTNRHSQGLWSGLAEGFKYLWLDCAEHVAQEQEIANGADRFRRFCSAHGNVEDFIPRSECATHEIQHAAIMQA